MTHGGEIIIETPQFLLSVGSDCIVRSLVCKATGEECADADEEVALFSVTQERPFNNEIKLSHPNKRTVYQVCRLRREGNELIVGFEIAPYEARVAVGERNGYACFTLLGFIVHPGDYDPKMTMDFPPAAQLRLLQLPVKHRACFGEWVNAVWDEKALVEVAAASPNACIDSERRKNCRILTADAVRETGLAGTCAALIVCPPDRFLDCMDALENDFDLPRGAASRRADAINRSAYWTGDIHPGNADEHIRFAKTGGFSMMLIYYTALFRTREGYDRCGDWDWRPEYPEGKADLKKMLDRIKAAGITPGFHFLHTHIGIRSRYVTPRLDHRLNKTRRFTLARPLGEGDTTVYVEENPAGSVMNERCRVLAFGGEAISYQSYTAAWPYRFNGCVRGHYDTVVTAHPAGETGGILDVSEYGHGTSLYLDQHASLQDEIADKIADIYSAGFAYCYFDGSEGTNPPYGYHVSNAQYRVWKKLSPAPLYAEGAAKSHFSWHMLSGGNAFDIFPPEVFKEKITQHPAEEAPRMRQDFTRLNFGWWAFRAPGDRVSGENGVYQTRLGTQPDQYEFGTSRAAAWDCPVTVMANPDAFRAHPRFMDCFEVMRRWEDVRASGFLTPEMKEMLKDQRQEHTLLINEQGGYELVPWRHLKTAAGGDARLRVFLFERHGMRWASFWHTTGEGSLLLPLPSSSFTVCGETGSDPIPAVSREEGSLIPVGPRRFLKTALSAEALAAAFENAQLL